MTDEEKNEIVNKSKKRIEEKLNEIINKVGFNKKVIEYLSGVEEKQFGHLEKYIQDGFLEDEESIDDNIVRIEISLERAFLEYVRTLESDEDKMECIDKLEDKEEQCSIIRNLQDDKHKMEYIDKFEDKDLKCSIIRSLRNRESVVKACEKNSELKTVLARDLSINMIRDVREEDWNFMKYANLEHLVIPYILSSTKYKITNRMDKKMLHDVEIYLGKPLPKNINELSIYEQVGVNLDVLEGSVIVSEKELNLDEIQKEYFSLCGSFEENKKRIKIKDFIGTDTPNLKTGVIKDDIKTWKDLIKNLARMKENIEKHSEEYLFSSKRDNEIRLRGVNGKFYVANNGNHTMTLLKAKYLTEIERANGDEKIINDIEKKYTVEVSSAPEVPIDETELINVVTLGNINSILIEKHDKRGIEELIENGTKVGYKIQEGEEETIVKSKEELQEHLAQRLEELKKDQSKYNEFLSKMNKYEKVANGKYSEQIKAILEEDRQEELAKEETTEVQMNDEPTSEEAKSREEKNSSEVNLWRNRFSILYNTIDRAPQRMKAKFVEMKSDILKSISEKLKERTAYRQHNIQGQDTNGR